MRRDTNEIHESRDMSLYVDPTLLESILLPECVWYVKFKHIIMLSKNFKEFQWHGKKINVLRSPCSAVSSWRQSAHSVTLRSSIRPHPLTLCTKLDVNEADRDIIHQPLHLGLMACRRQTCDVCIPHTHLLFLCQNISRQHSVKAHKWIF